MKQIIVPRDEKAIHDLDYDIATEEQLISWILTDDEYKELDSLNIFDLLNNQCNSLIDEYEDETIPYDRLNNSIYILSQYNNPVVKKICNFITEAINRKTSIHFYF